MWSINRLNQRLKKYDRDLFVKQSPGGKLHLHRKIDSLHKALRFTDDAPIFSQFILALTDNWQIDGCHVERGIDNVLDRLKQMDAWRDDSDFDKMRDRREQEEKNKDRAFRNNVRAIAYDIRRDFAKATDDIVTNSSMKEDKNLWQ